mmetsp:Transcript_16248/g.26833  ORF Transcript_16248/g.26833 Transcript_16248/m.26833 type:complete len:424 (+) Transcript_16248:32-1303(+)
METEIAAFGITFVLTLIALYMGQISSSAKLRGFLGFMEDCRMGCGAAGRREFRAVVLALGYCTLFALSFCHYASTKKCIRLLLSEPHGECDVQPLHFNILQARANAGGIGFRHHQYADSSAIFFTEAHMTEVPHSFVLQGDNSIALNKGMKASCSEYIEGLQSVEGYFKLELGTNRLNEYIHRNPGYDNKSGKISIQNWDITAHGTSDTGSKYSMKSILIREALKSNEKLQIPVDVDDQLLDVVQQLLPHLQCVVHEPNCPNPKNTYSCKYQSECNNFLGQLRADERLRALYDGQTPGSGQYKLLTHRSHFPETVYNSSSATSTLPQDIALLFTKAVLSKFLCGPKGYYVSEWASSSPSASYWSPHVEKLEQNLFERYSIGAPFNCSICTENSVMETAAFATSMSMTILIFLNQVAQLVRTSA